MSKKQSSDDLFCDFYAEWVKVYKEGAVRPITLNKYNMAHSWICKLAPDLKLGDLDRIRYQEIINIPLAEESFVQVVVRSLAIKFCKEDGMVG